jgi:hypothetical protein
MTRTASNRFVVDVTGMMLMLADEPSIWANHVHEIGFDLTAHRVWLAAADDLDGRIVRMIGRMASSRGSNDEASKVAVRMTPHNINRQGKREKGATRNFLGCRLYTHAVTDMNMNTMDGNPQVHRLVFIFDSFEVSDPV